MSLTVLSLIVAVVLFGGWGVARADVPKAEDIATCNHEAQEATRKGKDSRAAAPARPIRSSKAWTPTAPRIPPTRPPIGPACERRASDRHGLPDQARKRQEPAGVPVEGTPSDGGGARLRRALAKSQPRSRTDEARDHQVAGLFVARLAELPNIVGVKDSSGNLAQSLDLLQRRPAGPRR